MNHIPPFCARAILFAMATFSSSALFAASPVAVWDGAAEGYKFDSLTRTANNIVYTLSVNSENASVSAAGDRITIGSENKKWTVRIAADTAGAFGSTTSGGSGFTAILKASNVRTSADSNRSVINFYNDSKEAGWTLGHRDNGRAFPIMNDSAWTEKQTSGAVFSSGDTVQHIALVVEKYGNSGGTASFYVDGKQVFHDTSLSTTAFTTPTGLSIGGSKIDNSGKIYALCGMQVFAVAVFDTALTESEACAYTFPSETTPATGETYTYTGSLPTVSGDTFTSTTVPTWVTDPERWTGTIWLKDIPASSGQGYDFNPNAFGNTNSTVRLTGVRGYFARIDASTGMTVLPTVELVDENGTPAIEFTNGWGRGNVTTLAKLAGTGTMKCNTEIGGSEVIRVRDWSEFTGTLNLTQGKVVSFDDKETPDGGEYAYANAFCYVSQGNESWGVAYVATNATLSIPEGRIWTLGKGVHVAGSVIYESLSRCSGATAVTMLAGGEITEANSLDAAKLESALAKVSGDVTFSYDGILPPEGVFTNDAWTGTVKISNVAPTTPKSGVLYPFHIEMFGNTNSTISLTSIGSAVPNTAYILGDVTIGRVVLSDDGDTPALRLSDGLSDKCTTIRELAGSGTFTNINAGVFQGLAINVMTNFTGTLAPENMIVTFGTEERHGRPGGADNNRDTMRRLYIDPGAVLSVPAGFRLWAPVAVAFNGPVNFTTDAAEYDGLVLLDGTGSSLAFGDDYAELITINGAPVNRKFYLVSKGGGRLVVRKKHQYSIILR